jgi:purine-binding chemotaxis protein CheW
MTGATETTEERERTATGTDNERQLVLFQLSGENYGVDIYSVQRLIQVPEVTKVPRAPAFVEGVIDVRGDIIPVINLLKRFGISDAELRGDGRIVITEIGDQIVGFLVDAVSEVTTLSEHDIEPPSAVVAGKDTDFISGIGKQAQGESNILIIVLDVHKVLGDHELAYIEQVAEHPAVAQAVEADAASDDAASDDATADAEEMPQEETA